MLVAGEPGIGKTTLAARFAADVYDRVRRSCTAGGTKISVVPYQPWIEALTQLVTHVPEQYPAAHVADRGGISPGSCLRSQRVPVSSPRCRRGDRRFVLFGCVIDLLGRASAEYPLLLVLTTFIGRTGPASSSSARSPPPR